jgi:hypothetical protein
MYRAKVFNVMLASPGDVATERRMARDAIHEWNSIHSESRSIVLMPVGWETHSSPLVGDRPQAIINEQVLLRSDLLVAIFWTRLGTATGEAASGTVEEIEKHIGCGRPAMLYFSAVPVIPDSVDFAQFRALQEFKNNIALRSLFETYESISEFKEKFSRQLAQVLNAHSYFEPQVKIDVETIEAKRVHVSGSRIAEREADPPSARDSRIQSPILRPEVDLPPARIDPASQIVKKRSSLSSQLSPDAAALLVETAKDEGGILLRIETFGGLEISTNGRSFSADGDARSEARWEEAFAELRKRGLIRDKSNKGEVFGITKLGYELADTLGG